MNISGSVLANYWRHRPPEERNAKDEVKRQQEAESVGPGI